MKKFYFFAALAAAFSTASAEQIATLKSNVAGLTPATIADAKTTPRISITDLPAQPVASIKADGDAADDDFVSIGIGTWVEGPLDYFSDVKSGETHELEIFQSQSDENLYRMVPYGEGSALADLMGTPNSNPFYINVADPEKVLAYGDGQNDFFFPFEGFYISQYVPEAGWVDTANGYGVYDADAKTVSFPAKSFALYTSNGWALTNKDGKFLIYLPGADVKDYSFSSYADICNDDNVIRFIAEVGADVAGVKCVIIAGSYSDSASNLAYVAQSGNSITAGSTYTFTDDEPGVYTILLAAVDADGKVVDGAAHPCHIVADDDDQWVSVGTGVWTDPILLDAQYLKSTFDAEVDVQRNVNDPNLLRISSPYAQFSGFAISHEGHSHYIYIDITNPDEVKVDLSLTGIAVDFGHIRIWSVNSRYSGDSAEDLIAAGFGVSSYDAATNTITFPAKSLYYSEPEYANGAWYAATGAGKLVLPEENVTPDALFIVGSFGDAAALTKDGDLFKVEGIQLKAAEGAELCSFSFADAAEDAKYFFGAVEADEAITVATPSEFVQTKDAAAVNSWTVAPGYYNIEVDFANRTVTLTSRPSGIDGVSVDSENAPVEYFNLQGVRINQPTGGSLYIIRQGSKISKVAK